VAEELGSSLRYCFYFSDLPLDRIREESVSGGMSLPLLRLFSAHQPNFGARRTFRQCLKTTLPK
jgi:hypothetical protein